ncbi:MAG: hypothetical protein OEY01_12175 [Desulfobulbaceae bacterium]|nr:hypothetical protein [Desulfobulbaceae bacterium]
MLELEKWAKDKNQVMAMLAMQSATFAQELVEMLSYVRNQEHIEEFELPDPKQWLPLYHNHRDIRKKITFAFKQFDGYAQMIGVMFEFFINIINQPKDPSKTTNPPPTFEELPPETQQAAREVLSKFYEAHIQELLSEFNNTPMDDKTKKIVKENLIIPEFLFYFRIIMPCMLLYGTHPTQLLRKARLGDLESIDILLRLDKSLIGDPKILSIFYRASLSRNKRSIEGQIFTGCCPNHNSPFFNIQPFAVIDYTQQ